MSQKQRARQRRILIKNVGSLALLLGLALLVYLLYLGYQVDWTGFSVPACPANKSCPSNKTLWDWLQLFIIPLALAGAGFWFSQVQKKTEMDIAQKQKEAEQHIALDKQREDLLQAYLDRMSDLLLEKNLRHSALDAEVRNVARVRTLTVLSQLDTPRKNHVLSFLREAKLVTPKPGESIIALSKADMKNMNLEGVHASEIDFRGVDLRFANLSKADLSAADLFGANLWRANLSKADLSEADLARVNFTEAALDEANLSQAKFRHANLSQAVLQGANLQGADLSEADLRDAYLDNANLSEASIQRALNVTKVQLAQIKNSHDQHA